MALPTRYAGTKYTRLVDIGTSDNLADAIHNAVSGDVIILAEGTHTLSSTCTASVPLTIVADGAAVVNFGGYLVTLNSTQFIAAGVDFSVTTGALFRQIHQTGGSSFFDECTISSTTGAPGEPTWVQTDAGVSVFTRCQATNVRLCYTTTTGCVRVFQSLLKYNGSGKSIIHPLALDGSGDCAISGCVFDLQSSDLGSAFVTLTSAQADVHGNTFYVDGGPSEAAVALNSSIINISSNYFQGVEPYGSGSTPDLGVVANNYGYNCSIPSKQVTLADSPVTILDASNLRDPAAGDFAVVDNSKGGAAAGVAGVTMSRIPVYPYRTLPVGTPVVSS